MNKECEIVQDLLFGYVDGTLKNASKELVENHIKECNECTEILNEINNDINKKSEKKEIDYFKKVNKKLSKKSIIITVITILLVILIAFNVFVCVKYIENAETMQIYLTDDVTEEELSKIEQTIKEQDPKAEIIYNSKEMELNRMKEKFGENSYLLNGYENNNIFPTSYSIKSKINIIEKMSSKLKDLSGIRTIVTNINVNPYALVLYKYFM